MAANTANAVDCAVEVFGGWVTEMSPINLPAGVSPDCPECSFLPGSAFSRPAFKKVFNPALGANVSITYGKSYVSPTGTIYNFYLASDGTFYLENVTAAPGVANALFTTFAGLYARSMTAFGREYIAISDGAHGQDIPVQYDGRNLDRVTQAGPGAAPKVTSVALPASQMGAAGNTLTRQNNTVTCQTATAHGLKVGYQAQISNVPDSNATTVNQSNQSAWPSGQTGNPAYWNANSNEWRSMFNPGTSPLSALTIQGFGFTIPSAATILGVVVSAGLISQAATTGTVNAVALWNSGGQVGTAKAPATPFTTVYTQQNWGGSGDLWGAALTPAMVNDPSFGFAIGCLTDSIRVFIGIPFICTVYYTLSGSGTVAQIASIKIDNESFPGQALVTTTGPHGLIPNIDVSIVGVEPNAVANVSEAQWVAGLTTLTTATSHGLSPGCVIQVAGVTTSTASTTFSFNGTFTVLAVPSPNQLVYAQTPITSTDPDVIDGTAATGNVTITWPLKDTPTPTYFTVQSCPTPTTFYIAIDYTDGTWTTGTVGFIWEGTFFVTEVLNDTSFQYQQYGPNGATTAVGTVTPWGQAAPGIHRCRQSFLTRQGYLTKPSPWVQFVANGGQYLQIDDLAIGPPNIVARVLEFTGALGSQFYYLPVPGMADGITVSTATQIDDNTTTSVLLDFSDNSLFTGLCTSTPGNNTPAQIAMDGALGFASRESMAVTWGQRNRVTNLLNMDFQGGVQPTLPNWAGGSGYGADANTPTGWEITPQALTSFSLAQARAPLSLVALTIPAAMAGVPLSQSAYLDVDGAPILTPNTQYRFRMWGIGPGLVTVTISSASTGFTSTATLNVAAAAAPGAFYEAAFTLETPETIPEDMRIGFSTTVTGAQVQLGEFSLIFAETPYTNQILNASYADNPEAFDGVTGEFGPSDDPNQVMDFATVNDLPYILTRDPSGRLHEVLATEATLPSGWVVKERAANCGVLSAFALTKSQADDDSSSGGEEWMAWASESGARIFSGNQPWKISQEIQPNWNQQGSTVGINMAAALTAWSLNDPVGRLIYFGLPLAGATAPSAVYAMNYRELDTAEQIAFSPPYRVSFSGKLIATDNTRKWSPWYRPMNGAARMYRAAGELEPVFFGGTGAAPGASGYGNVYTLDPNSYTDDDYGAILSHYVSCALPTRIDEQMLQLGAGRKFLAYLTAYVSSIGQVKITVYPANLSNPWPLVCVRTPGGNPAFDLEWGGGNCQGQRMFFKIEPLPPSVGTDMNFNLQRLVPWFRKSAKTPVRGAAA